jgi:hypothetical protein
LSEHVAVPIPGDVTMSVRSRSVAAGIAATALLAGGAVAVPAAADAATVPQAAPALPLAVSMVKQAPSRSLVPGGAAGSVTLKVTNVTAKPQKFAENVDAWGNGSLQLLGNALAEKATPLAGTPAVTGSWKAWSRVLTIPAHATFSWKVSFAATKAWPRQDSGIGFEIQVWEPSAARIDTQMADFAVGTAPAGGPIFENTVGGATVAPGEPALETVTVTNRTGAPIEQPLDFEAQAMADSTAVRLAVDEWVGPVRTGHWQVLSGNGLVAVPAGLANGASAELRLRVRLVEYAATAPSVRAWVEAFSMTAGTGDPQTWLTVYRTA